MPAAENINDMWVRLLREDRPGHSAGFFNACTQSEVASSTREGGDIRQKMPFVVELIKPEVSCVVCVYTLIQFNIIYIIRTNIGTGRIHRFIVILVLLTDSSI